MKLVIFAGGIGTRLWPLSRENSPKQFDKIFAGKSTLQLAIERVKTSFGADNIFIQTVPNFKKLIAEQIPDLPPENIITEPARRNLGPAVCLSVREMIGRGHSGPLAILWADHLMDNPDEFIAALKAGEALIMENGERFVFLGERPRFANNNLGWIKVGDKLACASGIDYYKFLGWKYKPSTEECDRMFRAGNFFWNPGYFITSIEFLHEQYKTLAPAIYEKVCANLYEEAEATHFDRAIIEKVDLSRAVVIKTNMGWSDPGTLYALKEALEENKQANVTQGQVITLDTEDCLLYNFEGKKLLAGVGLRGMVVVNTADALIVVPREEVVKVTQLVQKIKEQGLNQFL